MKLLYIINTSNYEMKYINFFATYIDDEDEKVIISSDRLRIESYKHTFPKDKLNFEFEFGFVTDTLNKELLKHNLYRINKNFQKNCSNKDELEHNKTSYESALCRLENVEPFKEKIEKRNFEIDFNVPDREDDISKILYIPNKYLIDMGISKDEKNINFFYDEEKKEILIKKAK